MRTTLWKLGMIAVFALGAVGSTALADDSSTAATPERNGHGSTTILAFDTMIGNPGPNDPANVIRGFNGGGAPWAILRSVHGLLRSNGQLIVIVRGLVVAPLGANPVPQFRAALSCQDPADPNGGQLFFTGLFPATMGDKAGDANIIGRVTLPATCFAPLILIGSPPSPSSPDGAWFAVTGF